MASNNSACPSGSDLYVFCPHYEHEVFPVPCCMNTTSNGTSCGDPCPYDGSRPTTHNATRIIKRSTCHFEEDTTFVCKTPVPSYSDCCTQIEDTPCPQRCSQVDAAADVSFVLGAGTESQSVTSPTSSPSTSPYMTHSPLLATATTSTIAIDPLRPQNSAALTSVLNSGPGATHTDQPDLQNNRAAPKSNTAAVAGGIAGGVVGLALLLAVLAICYRQRITGPLKGTDQRKLPTWGIGQARAIGAGGGELEEIKPGPSPSNYILFPRPCIKLITFSSILTFTSTLIMAFTSTRLHTLQTTRQ